MLALLYFLDMAVEMWWTPDTNTDASWCEPIG